MRPVRRGSLPRDTVFTKYRYAKTDLIACISKGQLHGKQLGSYCSYCERNIATNLAVEHLIPKNGLYGNSDLECEWTNFLLACVNCNSNKSSKEVIFNSLFIPDRDNTFRAFSYFADGSVKPATGLSQTQTLLAQNTLKLVGLDKLLRKTYDADGNEVAQDRASQRLEIWGTAQDSLEDHQNNVNNMAVTNGIIKSMLATGFFSVWMTVFKDHSDMRNHFINAISGTRDSGCFNEEGAIISPHPDHDNLSSGGKI